MKKMKSLFWFFNEIQVYYCCCVWSIDLFMLRMPPAERNQQPALLQISYIMLHCSSFPPPNLISFFVGLLFMDSSSDGFS